MKNITLILLFAGLLLSGQAQDLIFEMHGDYAHAVKGEKLKTVATLNDLMGNNTSSLIDHYISVEITTNTHGKSVTAAGKSASLTSEQLQLLRTAESGDDIAIHALYASKNSVTQKLDQRHMNYSMTLVPDIEATFTGGASKMKTYFDQNTIRKIKAEDKAGLKQTKVKFTVNTSGGIEQVELISSSENKATDQLILEAISKMPKWKPATNSQGRAVPQRFEFILRDLSSGC